MKEIKIRIAVGILAFTLIYLITSFVKLSVDFTLWSETTRFAVGMFGSLLSIFLSFAPFEIKE